MLREERKKRREIRVSYNNERGDGGWVRGLSGGGGGGGGGGDVFPPMSVLQRRETGVSHGLERKGENRTNGKKNDNLVKAASVLLRRPKRAVVAIG